MKVNHIKHKRTMLAFLCCTILLISYGILYQKTGPVLVKSQDLSKYDRTDTEESRLDRAVMGISGKNSFFLTQIDKRIPALIQQYLNAKLEVDQNTIDSIVISDGIDYGKLQREIEYIKSYQNIETYAIKGINEIDYIVYVRYDVEFPKTTFYAPAMDEYYVVYNEASDSYQMYMKGLTDETMQYVLAKRQSDDVESIITNVTQQLLANLKADSNLLDIYNSLVDGIN